MTILLFFAVLFILILVHELGHFIVAKRVGMRVDEFGIGFPPKLWGFKKGETEYTFNALPIGGFVRILGEDGSLEPSSPVATEGSDRRSEASAEADEGGQNFDESISEEDSNRSFTKKSKWAQAAVLVAGVTMNILFAWLLFVVVFMMGVSTSVDEKMATTEADLVVAEVIIDTPAYTAGLPVGAVITSVSVGDITSDTLTPSSFKEFIINNSEKEIIVSYSFQGESTEVSVIPQSGIVEGLDEPAVGVSLTMVDIVSYSLPQALLEATITTANSFAAITVGITTLLVDVVKFDADLSTVAGPVGIVGLVGEAAQFGIVSLLTFTAFISINLAVINLLPVPALDGGRLLFVGIEAVIRRPINPVWMSRVNLVGFAFLLMLMAAVTYSDIAKML